MVCFVNLTISGLELRPHICVPAANQPNHIETDVIASTNQLLCLLLYIAGTISECDYR